MNGDLFAGARNPDKTRVFQKASFFIFIMITTIVPIRPCLSGEIDDLIGQGHKAWALNDLERTRSIGEQIVARNPGNWEGQRLLLFYSMKTKNISDVLDDFQKAIDQGAPAVLARDMEADYAYLVMGLPQLAIIFLAAYEKEWMMLHEQSS